MRFPCPDAQANRLAHPSHTSCEGSKEIFHGKLYLPPLVGRAGNTTAGSYVDSGVRRIEVGGIREIEGFRAQWQTRFFRDRKLLEQGQVDRAAVIAPENIPAGIAIGVSSGDHESVLVKIKIER